LRTPHATIDAISCHATIDAIYCHATIDAISCHATIDAISHAQVAHDAPAGAYWRCAGVGTIDALPSI